jgi:hypothetical protein
MNRRLFLFFLAFAALIAVDAGIGPRLVSPASAECGPGAKIDKTTVEETRQKLQKAGYKNIHDLRKGCDNTWHGRATKNGTEEGVAVLSDGTVVRDGD